MDQYDRIEPETETQRTEKALKSLANGAKLPFVHGTVAVSVGDDELRHPAAQHLVTLLVHLLARMKGLVHRIVLPELGDQPVLEGVPVCGASFAAGLNDLVRGLSGPQSRFAPELIYGQTCPAADVTIGIGLRDADFLVGCDAWRALFGRTVAEACWTDECPLGSFCAAAIGATEVFKRLLRRNLGWREGTFIEDLAFSLLNYGVDEEAMPGPDVGEVSLKDFAVAGAGAGGTAALYALGSFPRVSGEVVVVEPGFLKESNIGRYLMSDYQQAHGHAHKLDSVSQFLARHAPSVTVVGERARWQEVSRTWGTVLATVDTPEARWDVQRSGARLILDAGVIGTLYAVLRVVPGGWCLECKHPPDAEVTWKRRALRWGLPVEEIRRRYNARIPVSRADLERLADVQGRPVEAFLALEGIAFDQAPALTECGETPLSLAVPSQAPVMPFATTAAGIVLAAEVVKAGRQIGRPLNNYFTHDLRFRPRPDGHRFKPRHADCRGCSPPE
jgi:hypothetical protein